MNRMTRIALILLLTLAMAGVQQVNAQNCTYSPPNAAHSFDGTTLPCGRDKLACPPGQPILFRLQYFGAGAQACDEYVWSFGDGTSSSERMPIHNYANTGTFSVSVVVRNPLGSNTTAFSVEIRDLPQPTGFNAVTYPVLSLRVYDAQIRFVGYASSADTRGAIIPLSLNADGTRVVSLTLEYRASPLFERVWGPALTVRYAQPNCQGLAYAALDSPGSPFVAGVELNGEFWVSEEGATTESVTLASARTFQLGNPVPVCSADSSVGTGPAVRLRDHGNLLVTFTSPYKVVGEAPRYRPIR